MSIWIFNPISWLTKAGIKMTEIQRRKRANAFTIIGHSGIWLFEFGMILAMWFSNHILKKNDKFKYFFNLIVGKIMNLN